MKTSMSYSSKTIMINPNLIRSSCKGMILASLALVMMAITAPATVNTRTTFTTAGTDQTCQ
jgi:hypothetical protein